MSQAEEDELECAVCGYSDIGPDEVDIKGTDGIDIHCPECGKTTKRRWAQNEVNPRRLFDGL